MILHIAEESQCYLTTKANIKNNHRFLDEAGDTTFYGKRKSPIIGVNGVSHCFILGLVKFSTPLDEVRAQITQFQREVELDPYYISIRSIKKKKEANGFFFHATDDPPEVRKTFFELIKKIDCSCEVVVGRKIFDVYESKHNGSETEFYADLLSHHIKSNLHEDGKVIFNIARRGKSTKNFVLELAKQKGAVKFVDNSGKKITAEIVFNVVNQLAEPLLNIADYFCWAIQRVFERGETRYYDFIKEKLPVIVDLYDQQHLEKSETYYGSETPLTEVNKIK